MQDVLAGGGAGETDVAMGVGGGEDGDGVDRAIGEDGVETVRQREGEARGEGGAAGGARTEGGGDLDLGRRGRGGPWHAA